MPKHFEELLIKARDENNHQAQYDLGMAYYRGDFLLETIQNYETALVWLQQAAKENVDAQYRLGRMYDTGRGIAQDSNKALEWYKIAYQGYKTNAAKGDGHAQYRLGIMKEHGFGIDSDPNAAAILYRDVKNRNAGDAKYRLGRMYEKGKLIAQSPDKASQCYQKAIEAYEKLAEQENDTYAQYHLGLMYSLGWGVDENSDQALIWYQRAAKNGHVKAAYELGLEYTCIEDHQQEGIKWFQQAAEYGHLGAAFELAEMYYQKSDYLKALKWYEKVVATNHWTQPSALYTLSLMYQQGLGVKKNPEKAACLLKKASSLNPAYLQKKPELMQENGFGIEPKPANQGNNIQSNIRVDNGLADSEMQHYRNNVEILLKQFETYREQIETTLPDETNQQLIAYYAACKQCIDEFFRKPSLTKQDFAEFKHNLIQLVNTIKDDLRREVNKEKTVVSPKQKRTIEQHLNGLMKLWEILKKMLDFIIFWIKKWTKSMGRQDSNNLGFFSTNDKSSAQQEKINSINRLTLQLERLEQELSTEMHEYEHPHHQNRIGYEG